MAKPRRAKHAHPSDGFYSPRQFDDQAEELQTLLDEALAGSADAHAELLVNCYGAKMHRYFAQRLSNAHRRKADEDDLAQIARMHALGQLAGFVGRTPQSYWAWLRQICYRLVQRLVRFFRQAKRDLAREDVLDELKLDDGSQHPYHRGQQTPDEIVQALETAGQLQAALDQLPGRDRQIATLRFSEGLTRERAAKQLGLSKDAVKRACKRIMTVLRRHLTARYADGHLA